jgi:hypothetical protein
MGCFFDIMKLVIFTQIMPCSSKRNEVIGSGSNMGLL